MTPEQFTKFIVALTRLSTRFNVTMDEIEGKRRWAGSEHLRHPDYVLPRQALCFYGHAIGINSRHTAALLNRTVSAIDYRIRAFKDRLDTEPTTRELWQWLQAQ